MLGSLFLLSSGLFLGWSLGANNAANFFGTAVATRMIKFSTAAVICSIFVIIGAVVSGAGAADTLGKLGAISTMAGAFTVALAAAITSLFMTKAGIPISTSQAVVGGIIGWNFFAHTPTNLDALTKIAGTWIFSPILAALMSFLLFLLAKFFLERSKIHMITQDAITRKLLIIAGAFGAYSLGANNIGNVMGVFVSSSPFKDLMIGNVLFSSVQQLFLIGGIAVALGVITYSKRVMLTVGKDIFHLTPITALIVVVSVSLTLFLFASQSLHDLLMQYHLPAFPLVPVSSSQAVVGAVMGISLAKGGRNLNLKIIGKISIGWVLTPILTGAIAYFSLYFVENVFLLPTV
ncbi:MAG: inorganic phosphate transporter [Candidatus Cloacimonetes bacterium]|nr:inorganic phosphate transporter [Candidatus Cloacimonadota bacterium]